MTNDIYERLGAAFAECLRPGSPHFNRWLSTELDGFLHHVNDEGLPVPLALQIFRERRNTESDADAAIRVGRVVDDGDPRCRHWGDQDEP